MRIIVILGTKLDLLYRLYNNLKKQITVLLRDKK